MLSLAYLSQICRFLSRRQMEDGMRRPSLFMTSPEDSVGLVVAPPIPVFVHRMPILSFLGRILD